MNTAGLLENKYIFWIITGIAGAMLAAIVFFIKKQRERDEERFSAIEKKQEDERERLTRALTELPITYTLRDEFLRVSTQQNSKLDKIMDMIVELNGVVAGISGREK